MRFASSYFLLLGRKPLPGFSLAEVLIAIVIITILTIGSLAVYSTQIGKARDTERTNDVARIKLYLDQIVAEYGAPPRAATTARKIRQACKTDTNLYACFDALKLSSTEDLVEMVVDPSDGVTIPGTNAPFIYKYGSNANSYSICTTLEDQQSSLLNSNASGGDQIASGRTDNMYCLRYTAPGDPKGVTNVSPIDVPKKG